MAKEIERKFLVKDGSYKFAATEARHMSQGYLSLDPRATVRVRVAGGRGFITVKGLNDGAVRNEWEYEVPEAEALEMLHACALSTVITKTRHIVPADGNLRWEIDEFEGTHAGLVVAEIELPSAETPFSLPAFIGREVTDDPRYYNSSLATPGSVTPPRS